MHSASSVRVRSVRLGIAMVVGAASVASAQSRVVLPSGSVIIVRTTSALQSATARASQAFETTVSESVGIDEYTAIPAGSRIRGVIQVARAATRQQSGVIEVVFDRLTLPDGTALPITGKLTSTDSAERRQINSDPNARVALVGGRGGIGAAIAGASSGGGANNLLTALSGLLSEGKDVNVPAGTLLAVELESAVTLRGRGRLSGNDGSTIYTATTRIRSAQEALARLNYYRGPINGTLDDDTRKALFEFQVDRQLRGTGNLDGRTAQALGINMGVAANAANAEPGAALSAEDASTVRRNAQSLVTMVRSDLASTGVGRLDASRAYTQGELDVWFALSAFADNASVYEQVVRNGGNSDAAVLAGRSFVAAARRVDTAMQGTRPSARLQSAWNTVRRQLSGIDTGS